MITASNDTISDLINVQTGKQFRAFSHDKPTRIAFLNASTDECFTGCDDGIVRRWSCETVDCLTKYDEHEGPIADIVMDKEEIFLYTCSHDGTIKKWLTNCDLDNRILRFNNGKPNEGFGSESECTLRGHTDKVNCITLNWKETLLFSGSDDEKVKVWDIVEERCIRTIKAGSQVVKIAVSLDGKKVIAGCRNGTIKVFSPKTGELLRELKGHGDGQPISGLAFTHNNEILVSGSHDGTVKFWDIESGELRVTYHNLNEGFLWTTPPDSLAPHGWFWTDRPEVVNVIECEEDGEGLRVLGDEKERDDYIKCFNRQEMVMNRLNDYQTYMKDISPKPDLLLPGNRPTPLMLGNPQY